MRALMLATGEAGQWNEQLKQTRSWDLENRAPADAVLHEAFTMMMRQRFEPDVEVQQITEWVFRMREHFKADHLSVSLGEVLVRAALGEDLPTDDISSVDAWAPRVFLFGGAFSELYWDPERGKDVAALDAILAEAEQRAEEKGFTPLRVADVDPLL